MTELEQAYLQGFNDKCEEYGIKEAARGDFVAKALRRLKDNIEGVEEAARGGGPMFDDLADFVSTEQPFHGLLGHLNLHANRLDPGDLAPANFRQSVNTNTLIEPGTLAGIYRNKNETAAFAKGMRDLLELDRYLKKARMPEAVAQARLVKDRLTNI